MPVETLRKESTDKRKAPEGTFEERTNYGGGDHSRVFGRLGLDLLEVTPEGGAVVHAKSERFQQLLRRTENLKDAGILDGDLVAVHRTPDVHTRQIIVARLEDEVTVKRYRQEGKLVWLLPENPDFEPIQVDLQEQSLVIEGVVVGVIRRDTA